jgi:glucuronate isomerase
MAILDDNRLFPIEPSVRAQARALYDGVRDLPIISPHGHTDPRWFAENAGFANPSALFVTPDHYVFRMLHSQGVSLDALGVPRAEPLSPAAWHAVAAVARSRLCLGL